jgi:hypothetical protein
VISLVEVVNPLTCPAWDRFVASQPAAAIFHSTAWARLLVESYRFTPAYLVQHNDGQPVAAWPLMQLGGRLLPRRGVSLPFTDSCPPLIAPLAGSTNHAPGSNQPLARPAQETAGHANLRHPNGSTGVDLDATAQNDPFLAAALAMARQRGWRSIELREADAWMRGQPSSVEFYGHTIDLAQGDAAAFQACDPAVRRSVRKAQASNLRIVEGHDPAALQSYFRLHCLTRRRHGLPPQPFSFFARLQKHLLASGLGSILLALKDQTPVAGAVFLFWGPHALYKFGASDERFQGLRPNNLVFREALRICRERGCSVLDLGRTSLSNEGLRRFKLGWGSRERVIRYLRYHLGSRKVVPTPDRASGWHASLFRHLPRPAASLIGKLAYRFAA